MIQKEIINQGQGIYSLKNLNAIEVLTISNVEWQNFSEACQPQLRSLFRMLGLATFQDILS